MRSLAKHFETMAGALQHRQTQLLEALQQKEMLLKEVNHRVKNSLQLVASLLGLQRSRITDKEARRQFEDAARRINTVAQIHQRLYLDENVERVAFDHFLRELCADLNNAMADGKAVAIVTDVVSCHLPTEQVVPVALIVNELITNALKYAYPDQKSGAIRVNCRREPGALVVSVSDDGSSLPQSFDFKTSSGLGMQMIVVLSRQLRAQLDVSRQEAGKSFILKIPVAE